MKPRITTAQLTVLEAARHGRVSMPAPPKDASNLYDLGTWRVGGPDGRSVTTTAVALIERGLAVPSEEPCEERRPLMVTAEGLALLGELAGRGPADGGA